MIRVDQMRIERHDDSQRSSRLAVTVGDLGDLRVVDRVVASIASLPRLGFDGSMMTRHDDSQRSDRLAVTVGDLGDLRVVDRVAASTLACLAWGFDGSMMTRHDDSQRSGQLAVTVGDLGDLRVVDRVVASIASSPRLGSDGSVMERHDDSQRSGPSAVTVGDLGDLRVVDRVVASIASSPRLGFDGSMTKRHDSQHSGRLAVTRPVDHTPPRLTLRAEQQLTAPADRSVRDPAHAVAFTTAVAIAIGGAGSVHRRTGMRTARALPADRNRPGSPPATVYRRDPPRRGFKMILKEPLARAA